MVILSASVCNKKGKILVARQYVPMTRLRIEGLLAAFPKLVDSEDNSASKQHTFVESDEVRYIYQPMDTLYLLLITNMQSNILEDLQTLRMIAKLIPEYCDGHDEECVQNNAFELIFAMDEVVTPMGYREQVTYQDIDDYVKMDSAEEKLAQIIDESKEQNQREIMKQKAAQFDKAKKAQMKAGLSGNKQYLNQMISGIGGGFSGNNKVTSLSSETYKGFGNDNVNIEYNNNDNVQRKFATNDDSDSDEDRYRKSKKSNKNRKVNRMILGGNKTKKDKWLSKQEEIDRENLMINNLMAMKTDNNMDDIDDGDLKPVELNIIEKMTLLFDRELSLKKFEIKGDMELIVNTPDAAKCKIIADIPKKNEFERVNWRLHPRMNSKEFKNNILCLKDNNKSFKIGRSSKVSILKWRMSTTDEALIPITLNFWADADSSGTLTITAEYTNQYETSELKNVIITIPCTNEPEMSKCEGEYQYYKKDKELQWILGNINNDDTGSIEYTVDDMDNEDLYPISIHFETDKTYSNINIKSINNNDDSNNFEYSVKNCCIADKYQIQ